MKIILAIAVSSVVSHDHASSCKVAIDRVDLTTHVTSLLECIPKDGILDEKAFDECTEGSLASLVKLDAECFDCMTHYVEGHFENDVECWLQHLKDGKNGPECITSITDSLHDVCFTSN